MNPKVSVIIAAAGIGQRMGAGKCKQLLELDSKPILHHSISVFDLCDSINEIIIVTNHNIYNDVVKMLSTYKYKKVKEVLIGGKERQDSVKNALDFLTNEPPEIVLIHDAVRPFIKNSFITSIVESAKNFECVIPALKLKDTIKYTSDGKYFDKTPDRTMYRLIQTPQAFNFAILSKAYSQAYRDSYYGTDDSSLVERLGIKPYVFDGCETNIKITTPNDLKYAEILIKDFNYME
jgi:2-C-methyl-D-erythritol 4-phosphate cytidylyltransferase